MSSPQMVSRRGVLATVAGTALAAVWPAGVSTAVGQRLLRRGGYSNIPSQADLAPFGLRRHWVSQASFDAGSDDVSSVVADETGVFVVSTRGNVTAFNAETGGRLWAARLGADDRPVLKPVTNQTQVILVVGTSLVALDKQSGMVQWELLLDALPSAGPAADERNVYVGFEDGGVAAYDLRKVRELFNAGKLGKRTSYIARVWTYRTSKSISSPPITDGNIVGFASRSGVFYAVDASTRNLRYLFEGAKPIEAPVTAANDRVVIPCEDLNTYCIDKRRGNVLWTVVTGLPVQRKPTIIGRRVYLSPGRAGLLAVDLESGRRLWRQPRATEFVSSSGGVVYCTSDLGQLMSVDGETGEITGVLPVTGFERHVDNERTDRIFMVTTRGTVLCLRERDRDFPRYHLRPEQEPIRPEFAADGPPPAEPSGEAV